MLDACLPKVDRVLVIGWRGAEQHFLDRLRAIRGKATPFLIVGYGEEGTRTTIDNLVSAGFDETAMTRFTDGFGGFLETKELEAFLGSSVANLRSR
jgi:hypothetical protein